MSYIVLVLCTLKAYRCNLAEQQTEVIGHFVDEEIHTVNSEMLWLFSKGHMGDIHAKLCFDISFWKY